MTFPPALHEKERLDYSFKDKPRELCSLKFKASSLLKSLAATSSVCLEAQLKIIKPLPSLFLEKLK